MPADPCREERTPAGGTVAAAASSGRRRGALLVLAAAVLLYLGLAVGSARQKSVTVDELGHLPSGVYFLLTGDPRYAALNPPLINALSALPVLALTLDAPLAAPPPDDAADSFWANGYHFQESHRTDYLRIFDAARLVPIALVACLALLCFGWGLRLAPGAPEVAGLLAACALCLSPNVIAHARLVATDTGTALAVAAALLALRSMLRRPGVATALLCGLALGIAQLTKFYALLLYPVFAVVALLWCRWAPPPRVAPGRAFACLALAAAASVLVLDTGYLWREVGVRLDDMTLASPVLSTLADGFPGAVPLPLPGAFVRALDGQLAEVGSTLPSYLFGETFEGGRWYYFLGVLALKTPPGLAVLFALAVGLSFGRRRLPAHESALLLGYPAMLFLLLSASPGRQLGGRALLSAAPLVWLWAGATVARALPPRWPAVVAGAAVLATAASSVAAYPHYLSYFNVFAGGVDGGYRYASDSNVDIGQDLPLLARFLADEGERHVQLLYFGSVDPRLYGIDYVIPEGSLEPGLFAVSVSLYRTAYPMYDDGGLRIVGPVEPVGIGDPIASLGGSIHVYRVGP